MFATPSLFPKLGAASKTMKRANPVSETVSFPGSTCSTLSGLSAMMDSQLALGITTPITPLVKKRLSNTARFCAPNAISSCLPCGSQRPTDRFTGGATNEVQTRNKSQGREGGGPHRSDDAARTADEVIE